MNEISGKFKDRVKPIAVQHKKLKTVENKLLEEKGKWATYAHQKNKQILAKQGYNVTDNNKVYEKIPVSIREEAWMKASSLADGKYGDERALITKWQKAAHDTWMFERKHNLLKK